MCRVLVDLDGGGWLRELSWAAKSHHSAAAACFYSASLLAKVRERVAQVHMMVQHRACMQLSAAAAVAELPLRHRRAGCRLISGITVAQDSCTKW